MRQYILTGGETCSAIRSRVRLWGWPGGGGARSCHYQCSESGVSCRFPRISSSASSARRSRAAVSENAAAFAADLAPVLADIKSAGHTSLRAIATELTVRGIRTRRGGNWSVGNLKQLMQRTSVIGNEKTLEEATALRPVQHVP